MALALPNCTPRMTALEMIQALQENKIIDRHVSDILHQLRKYGNDAAHNTDASELTKDAARRCNSDRQSITSSACWQSYNQMPPPQKSRGSGNPRQKMPTHRSTIRIEIQFKTR
jgi:hypothetical protein